MWFLVVPQGQYKKKVVNNSERSSFFSYSACGVKPYSRCFFNEPFQNPNYVFIPSDTNTRHWRAKKEYYSKIRTTILHPDSPDSSTRDRQSPCWSVLEQDTKSLWGAINEFGSAGSLLPDENWPFSKRLISPSGRHNVNHIWKFKAVILLLCFVDILYAFRSNYFTMQYDNTMTLSDSMATTKNLIMSCAKKKEFQFRLLSVVQCSVILSAPCRLPSHQSCFLPQ